jgi:DegV family protein with EDD domain
VSIRIVTDSTCDLPAETVDRLNIHVIPLYVHMAGQSYLDGVDLSREEFYRRLPGLASQPTTAAPGSERFAQVYDSLTEQGADQIVSIHIAQSLSATLNFARSGAEQARVADVTVVDSGQLSLGVGYIVQEAAERAAQGHTIEEILQAVSETAKRTFVFAALDTLEFLKRSGRMSWAIATLGEMLRIRPILRMNDGVSEVERVRTETRALARVAEMLRERLPVERVALVHTNARERAEALLRAVAELLPPGELPMVDITPVIGAHIGPNAVGFACVSEAR